MNTWKSNVAPVRRTRNKNTRNECLDQQLFFNKHDLMKILGHYKKHYNETRAHSSLEKKTPNTMTLDSEIGKKVVSLDRFRWKSACNELYRFPVAA
ncbi:MAG: transposase [Pseudomonadales bacterium]|nr:transposase [Pseudomonadales bacterium]